MGSHILIIGATGASGLEFCNAALAQGHTLTIYARNPDKIPSNITDRSGVYVWKGALNDMSSFCRAATSGPTVFVSFAGPVGKSKGTPVTDALKEIFPVLVDSKYRRAMILGTPSFQSQQDRGALKWKASIMLVKVIAGSAYDEFKAMGEYVASQDVTRLKWTLFRVPFLNNGPDMPVVATYTGSGSDGMSLSRKSLATWILGEMGEDSEWVGKAPVLSN